MKVNINPAVKAIVKEIKKNIELIFEEEYELFDMFVNVREDIIEELCLLNKIRVYNQYQNESCKRLFANNSEIRLFDFSDFISKKSCVYFTVESCNDIKELSYESVKKLVISDIEQIICYIMKNVNNNNTAKMLYIKLISGNL